MPLRVIRCAVSLRMRQWDELAKEWAVPVMGLGVLKRKAEVLLAAECLLPSPQPSPGGRGS